MKRSRTSLALALLGLTAPLATAEQFGLFTYKVNAGGTVTITDYPEDGVGHLDLPAEIEGRPLTGIGASAFRSCSDLTHISIPNSITIIPASAFNGCSSLAEIHVDPQNPDYATDDGVLFDKSRSTLIRCPEGKSGSYSIPDGVTRIDHLESRGPTLGNPGGYTVGIGSAFSGCTRLTSITIPDSITELHQRTFEGCTALNSLIFVGDSPRFRFDDWCCWETESPESPGAVNLIVPGRPPIPQVGDGLLSIRFDPSFKGFGYRVATSSDLVHWTTEGVLLSPILPDGTVQASVPLDGPTRFLRLVPYITNWRGGSDEEGCGCLG